MSVKSCHLFKILKFYKETDTDTDAETYKIKENYNIGIKGVKIRFQLKRLITVKVIFSEELPHVSNFNAIK